MLDAYPFLFEEHVLSKIWKSINRYSIGRNESIRRLPTENPNKPEDYEEVMKTWENLLRNSKKRNKKNG